MGNIVCSIVIKRGIVAILIIENGTIKKQIVERIKDKNALSSSYQSMIYAFTLALRYIRQYIQDNNCSRDVCFEISNSIFIKWVNNQYSKEAYQDEFMNALKMLHALPIRYQFSYSVKPKAFAYASEGYCKKEVISGLDLTIEDMEG